MGRETKLRAINETFIKLERTKRQLTFSKMVNRLFGARTWKKRTFPLFRPEINCIENR